MKKIKSLRLASILLIGTLLTTCLLGGTFAKYTTAASGSSSTVVARWSFCANGKDIAVSPNAKVTFNLFDTIYDEATASEADADVVTKKIAPGTAGRCSMLISNTSDISAKYTISLAETNDSGLPIQYSIDGENWVDSIAELPLDTLTDQVINYKDKEKEVEHTVYWRWVFDGSATGAHVGQSDETDSTFGTDAEGNSEAEVKVTATITASQID